MSGGSVPACRWAAVESSPASRNTRWKSASAAPRRSKRSKARWAGERPSRRLNREAGAHSWEPFADHFLALRPQRLGAFGIKRIGLDPGPLDGIGLDLRHMAILAIVAPDLVRLVDRGRPHGRRCALRDGLEPEVRLARGAMGGVDPLDQRLGHLARQMAGKLGLNAARMDGRRADAARLVAAVEFDREQDIGRLRTAVAYPRVIRRAVEIRIVEVDVGKTMAGRGQVDQPRPRLHQARDPV